MGMTGISGTTTVAAGLPGGTFLSNTLGTSPSVLGGLGVEGLNLINPAGLSTLGAPSTTPFPNASSLPTIITTLYEKEGMELQISAVLNFNPSAF